jgi:hypothetical protein
MTFKEVILATNGLRKRDEMHEAWIRRATLLISVTNFGGKGVVNKFDKYWPTRNGEEKKGKVSNEIKDILKGLKDQDNQQTALLRAKQKIDARGSESNSRS